MSATEYYIVVLLLIFMVAISIKPRAVVLKGDVLISSEASHVLKAVASIVIVMHHFGLRKVGCDDCLLTMIKIGGGSFALPLFLLLSAYGITKSEMKRKLGLKSYLNHRMMKLMIPFWLAATSVTILYALTAIPVADTAIIKTARLGESFIAIGRGEYSWSDYLMSCVGLRGVSGSHWFVLVTLVSYLLFLALKETVGLNHRNRFVALYTIGLMAFGGITMLLEWPAHYWRNLWALAVGLTLALYEKELMQKKIWLLVGLAAINIYLVVYSKLFHDAGPRYIVFANVSLAATALYAQLMTRMELRKGFNIVVWLSGLSYMVYLVHCPLLNEQWLLFGRHNSLLLIVAVAIIVAMPLDKTGKIITNKI